MRESRLGLALTKTVPECRVVLLASPVEDMLVEGVLLGGRPGDVSPHPIADLSVGDGLPDDRDEVVGTESGGLQPLRIESAVGEVGLVVLGESPGEVESDLVDEPGR